LGKKICLVSDAGTPSISDPGYLLVKEANKLKLKIECLPGPTALIPALVKSGLPSEKFVFEGFLPTKKGRKKRLDFLLNETRTMIFYESPLRLLKTIEEFKNIFGDERKVSVSREISKIYEETINGSLSKVYEILLKKKIKGEIVIVLTGYKK
jgi:16S rRNA (cytidine1402-2'-O)-methyltransferase